MDWSFLIRNNDSLCVSTDTRNLPSGCVFFALKGETFDGNRFALQALEKGAAMAVVSDAAMYVAICEQYGKEYAMLISGAEAERGGVVGLQSLARAWRRHLGLPIIGVTGTNGKTTTKELTAAVLSTKYHIHYTQGNLNNSIGVPLTLLQLTRQHELAIVEMGASHPGDIEELVNVAEPNFGVITNVGRAHLQGFGSFEGVQHTKQELYDYLCQHEGTIFRNVDNTYLGSMYADACAKAGKTPKLVEYHRGTMPTGTHLVGDYNAENVSAALCIGEYFGISQEQGLSAIRAYIPSNNRSQLVHSDKGNTIVVDAYNANPTSMSAAIESFSQIHRPIEDKVLILGDMLELGADSVQLHQEIVDLLLRHGYMNVYLVGNEFGQTHHPFKSFTAVQELTKYLEKHTISDKLILLKGSHGMHLETLKEML